MEYDLWSAAGPALKCNISDNTICLKHDKPHMIRKQYNNSDKNSLQVKVTELLPQMIREERNITDVATSAAL